MTPRATFLSPRYKSAFLVACGWVVFLWFLAVPVYDYGELAMCYKYALSMYATLWVVVLLRRPLSPTVADLRIIKWSLPFLFLLCVFFCPALWRWRSGGSP